MTSNVSQLLYLVLKKQWSAPMLKEKIVPLYSLRISISEKGWRLTIILIVLLSKFDHQCFLLYLPTLESKLHVRCDSTVLQTMPILLELPDLLLQSPASLGLWICSWPAVSVSHESANSWIHFRLEKMLCTR